VTAFTLPSPPVESWNTALIYPIGFQARKKSWNLMFPIGNCITPAIHERKKGNGESMIIVRLPVEVG
jgi:hypothetical protein